MQDKSLFFGLLLQVFLEFGLLPLAGADDLDAA